MSSRAQSWLYIRPLESLALAEECHEHYMARLRHSGRWPGSCASLWRPGGPIAQVNGEQAQGGDGTRTWHRSDLNPCSCLGWPYIVCSDLYQQYCRGRYE